MTRETGEKDNVRQRRQDPLWHYTTGGEGYKSNMITVYFLHGDKVLSCSDMT